MSQWTVESRAAAVDAVLTRAPVVPVISIADASKALDLARCLVSAGLPVLEITLRTEAAIDAIAAITAEVPEACVGAGTVLSAADLDAVIAAGARFAISPGATESLYDAAEHASIPLVPAVATASELMRGLERGHRRFKFFPAEPSGGVSALRSLHAPFPHARFCPTGGIDLARAPAYLALANVAAVGGSWMLPPDALASGNWDRIAALAREAAELTR